MSLATVLEVHAAQIQKRLYIGRAHWDNLVGRITKCESQPGTECEDEQLWTFILACAYAIAEEGPAALGQQLTDVSLTSDSIWFECLPQSPRLLEGQSNLDLALGHLRSRSGTRSGIELALGTERSVVFCEFKWYSDISYCVSASRHRNQLARVIENALLLRAGDGSYADYAYVVLVTPSVFQRRDAPSRLYWYKWHEYAEEKHEALLRDLQGCGLSPAPELLAPKERLSSLRLLWKSFEDIAFAIPQSPVRDALAPFWNSHAGPDIVPWPS